MEQMEVKQMEAEVIIQRTVYFDDYRSFGIYACATVEQDDRFTINQYGNISIQGTGEQLQRGGKYNFLLEGEYEHVKYGIFYKIVPTEIGQLETVIEQDQLLRAILPRAHYNALKTVYPDEKLVDLILADQIDTQLTKGIKEKTLANIKIKIKEKLDMSKLIVKLKELEISLTKLKKIQEYYGSTEEAIRVIDTDIYDLCKIKTFGFKTVDEIALKRGDDPESPKRIQTCILQHLLADLSDGHSWSLKSELLNKSTETLNLPLGLIESALANMKQSLVFQNDVQVALVKVVSTEVSIFEHLKRIAYEFTPPNITNIVARLKKTEEEQGFEFTVEQREAIIEGSQHGVMILNGLAGAGKTATVKGLIDSLGTTNYMTAALSGKAVNVLSQRNINASTIHRMLKFKFAQGAFEYNADNPLPYAVLVLDEMSMNDTSLVNSVLSAIPNGAKLILVGDSGQLPAIGNGDVLRDLLNSNYFPKFELTKVHRQAAKSGILSLANNVRKGKQIFPYNTSGIETFGELQDQTVIAYHNKENILPDLLEIAKSYATKIKVTQDLFDFQVIVANKERGELSVKKLNIALQSIFNGKRKPFIRRNGYDYKEGDKILTRGNMYGKPMFSSAEEFFEKTDLSELQTSQAPPRSDGLSLFNGTMGYIYGISMVEDVQIIFIRLEGFEGLFALCNEDIDKIEMAYAATVHRLQGSSIKNVVFALDFTAYKLLSKQLIYTALTRASKKGVALVETNALHAAIKTDASNKRRTFLADLLINQK